MMKSLLKLFSSQILAMVCIQLAGIGLALAAEPAIPGAPADTALATDLWLRLTVIVFLVLIIGSVFSMLFVLQRRFLDVCREKNDLGIYAQSPFGVPSGTIRSLLALSIVFASIGYLAISMTHNGIKFPDVMVGILGSVLGFYFGSRGAAGRANDEVLERLGTTRKERDQAVDTANQGKLSGMVDKARNSVAIARSLSKVLPAETAQKLDRVINVVDKSLEVAGGLAGSGKTTEALSEVGSALDKLDDENPIRELLIRASGSFGSVLGGAIPPLAVASVVITVGSRLAGAAYSRWVARVLNAPYTPELFPPTVVDGAVAMSIMRSSPLFASAFADEIQRGDLHTVRETVRSALDDLADDTLWQQPHIAARFADQDELQTGINQLQRAAMSLEVAKDIEPGELASVGSLTDFMDAIDTINANESSQRELDALVLMMDELKKQDQPVESVFNSALDSIRSEQAA